MWVVRPSAKSCWSRTLAERCPVSLEVFGRFATICHSMPDGVSLVPRTPT